MFVFLKKCASVYVGGFTWIEQLLTNSVGGNNALYKEHVMNPIFSRLCERFDHHELKYQVDADHEAIQTVVNAQSGTYPVAARTEQNLLQFWAQSPTRIPDGCLPMVSETIARINFRMKLGCFQMDYSDGELLFYTAVLVQENLDDKTIARLFITTITMMDHYMPVIHAVIFGNESPKDAVLFAEI